MMTTIHQQMVVESTPEISSTSTTIKYDL